MYDNKKIFILGMARSGYEVAKVLKSHNCEILITDMNKQDADKVKELKDLGVNLIITDKPEELLDETFDYVVKNPGVKLDHKVCLKANNLNIPIINEVEVAYHYLPRNVKIIGITGSNGKTTTTTLTYNILKEANLNVHLGGNIGIPVCALLKEIKENDILVLEISSHQLHDLKDFKCDIGVLTNLSEVHLDHFGTYEYYQQTKKKIFNNQTNNDLAIVNKYDNNVLKQTKNIKSNKLYFSSKVEADACIKNNAIYYKEEIIKLDEIKLQGNHNYENIMCAIMIAKQFNVSNEIIKKVLKSFNGVEHRLEFVRTLNNRDFYNDSKATNVVSTIIALDSFKKPTILLLGGLDRGHSFDSLLPHMNNIKFVVSFGETNERILEFCNKNNIKCYKEETLIESINTAYNNSNEGDIILLSPACASWDQYKRFEDRGDEFKKCVNDLK